MCQIWIVSLAFVECFSQTLAFYLELKMEYLKSQMLMEVVI